MKPEVAGNVALGVAEIMLFRKHATAAINSAEP